MAKSTWSADGPRSRCRCCRSRQRRTFASTGCRMRRPTSSGGWAARRASRRSATGPSTPAGPRKPSSASTGWIAAASPAPAPISAGRRAANGANGTYRQAGTGISWSFGHVSAHGPGPVRQSYATNARHPNGEVIGYTYETAPNLFQSIYRPIRLESSLGYFIAISYSSADLGSPDWGRPAEAALYSDAAPTVPLARLSYSYDYSNGDTIVTIADLGGRIFTCTNCVNSLGQDIAVRAGSSQLPGDAAPSRQAAALPTLALVGSVLEDGVERNYAYTRNGGTPSFHAPSNSYWYSRLAVTGPGGFSQVYNLHPDRPAKRARQLGQFAGPDHRLHVRHRLSPNPDRLSRRQSGQRRL